MLLANIPVPWSEDEAIAIDIHSCRLSLLSYVR